MSIAVNIQAALGKFRSESGSFAVEAALVAPALIFFVMLAINFGMAYNMRLQLVTAAGAGVAYAQNNPDSASSSNFAQYAANITTVAQNSANFGSTPVKVAVSVNNTPDGSAADDSYCVKGSPPTWTKATGTSTDCGSGVTPGKFVTLTLSATVTSIFPTDGIVGTFIPLREKIIARVQ